MRPPRCPEYPDQSSTRRIQHMLVRYDPFRQLDRLAIRRTVPPAAAGCRWTPSATTSASSSASTSPASRPTRSTSTVERKVLTVRAERSWTPAEGDEVLAQRAPAGLGHPSGDARRDARHRPPRGRTSTPVCSRVTIPVAEQAKAAQGRDPRRCTAEPLEVGSAPTDLTDPHPSRARPRPFRRGRVRASR